MPPRRSATSPPTVGVDVDVPDNVRIYLCSSTQHAPDPLPLTISVKASDPPNTIDYPSRSSVPPSTT